MGPPRHLALLGTTEAEQVPWPVPFADGIDVLKNLRGRQVAVLVSGDPFWFGAGRAIARAFAPEEWRALPSPSTFSRVAARLGWSLEDTPCLGLHAAPLEKLRPHLSAGERAIVLLRDGAAVQALAGFLESCGFGDSTLTVCEAMGGSRERVRAFSVPEARVGTFTHPVCVALEVAGDGPALPHATGLPDDMFASDGVMTKRPVRALTLSALAPVAGEHLWDIGGGSGTIAVEWALAHPRCTASVVEVRRDRADLIEANARAFGLDRLAVHVGDALQVIDALPRPDAVFIGGGLSETLLARITALPKGTRIVANGVTLEAEALLSAAAATHGGDLMRIEIAHASPLGPKRGWKSSYPVVQWSVIL